MFFFFVPVSRQSGAQEKNSAARASAPNVELGAGPEWGLCWLVPSPPPLPPHMGAMAPVRGAADCLFSRSDRPELKSPEVAREAPRDVLLLGDSRS